MIRKIRNISVGLWVLFVILLTIGVEYTIGGHFPILDSVLSAVSAVTVWWICHLKYQSIQSPPKLKVSHAIANGFTFIAFEAKGVPTLLKPEREASGLIWEGFTVGISKESGKVGSIAVWLYGSNEGVGHYVCLDRTDRFRSGHWEGHFNLKPYARDNARWRPMVLREACEIISISVGTLYRPVSTSYDEKRENILWYDDESKRNVYFNEKRTRPTDDLFVFGPSPK